ncbi:hypothetical protein FPQ18DRAFT_302481 [Pyronema domesticum]|nr:hypothetical protein FPQ18DRAFT_302481 [Pyronema domesticum]
MSDDLHSEPKFIHTRTDTATTDSYQRRGAIYNDVRNFSFMFYQVASGQASASTARALRTLPLLFVMRAIAMTPGSEAGTKISRAMIGARQSPATPSKVRQDGKGRERSQERQKEPGRALRNQNPISTASFQSLSWRHNYEIISWFINDSAKSNVERNYCVDSGVYLAPVSSSPSYPATSQKPPDIRISTCTFYSLLTSRISAISNVTGTEILHAHITASSVREGNLVIFNHYICTLQDS